MKTNRREFIRIMALVAVVTVYAGCAHVKDGASARKPNVVLIMTDDQGYGDLACHGNPIVKTPNMDALHDESVRLTNFHVSPVCAPTRGALLTGCYSHRVNVWHVILRGTLLLAGQPTIADVFSQNGYRTGMFGKWHLGGNYPYRPVDRGFQEVVSSYGYGGGIADAADYWGNDRVNDMLIRNGELEKTEGYSADFFYDEAIKYVKKNRDQPFFLYLPSFVPHTPCSIADKAWADPYTGKVSSNEAYFFASISRIDWNIGRLRKCLDELGITDNTIFIFMTDNGTADGERIFNAGMKGKKGSIYDGGHRVPCFIHWPKGGLDQPKDVSRLTAHIDLLPTLMDLCGLENQDNIKFDGTSIKPLLVDPQADMPQRTLVTEGFDMPPKKWRPNAVMTEQWRLVNNVELYDIQVDPGQNNNIAKNHPEVIKQLQDSHGQYWASVTENDDVVARDIIGSKHQIETRLTAYEAMNINGVFPAYTPGLILNGLLTFHHWNVYMAQNDQYRIEVRRWPREADTPMRAKYILNKTADAWQFDKPVTGMFWNGVDYYTTKSTALPIHKIKLQIGDQEQTLDVKEDDKACVFTMDLPKGPAKVEAVMIDESGKAFGSAYYVYIRPVR